MKQGDSAAKTNKREPPNTPFHQQRLKNWSFVFPRFGFSVALIIIGIIFVPVGTKLRNLSDNVYVDSIYYDTNGGGVCHISERNAKQHCNVSFTLTEDISGPLYVYYEIEDFYQNHRRYFGSKSILQLQGAVLTYGDLELECTPLLKNGSQLLNPCGLIANSFFTDEFVLYSSNYSMAEDDIALPSDAHYLFKQVDGFKSSEVPNITSPCNLDGVSPDECQSYCSPAGQCYKFYYPDDDSTQYLYETYPDQISPIEGVTNQHFIVWMRTATLPTFRKLYGKIQGSFSKGQILSFGITANYEVSSFGGSKALVISTVGEFGGQNAFPGIAFITTGAFAFLLALVYGIKDVKTE